MNKVLVGLVAVSAWVAPHLSSIQHQEQKQQTTQLATITGKITSASTGAPLAMANVVVDGTALGTTTNSEGLYRIERVPPGRITLRAMRLGYAPDVRADVAVTVNGANVVDFALKEHALILSGVVTTGLSDPTSGKSAPFSVAMGAAPQVTALKSEASNITIQARNPYSIAFVPPSQERQTFCAAGTCTLNTETYAGIVDNPFLAAAFNPLSTFSIDVDHASYSNVRRYITEGQLPPKDAVRIEEFINYFTYDYRAPAQGAEHPFLVTTDLAPAPWKRGHQLVRVGLQAVRLETAKLPPSNLVFLIDVSGSMQPANKLPLVKQSLRMLVEQLREQDRVAMVVYAGSAGLVLEPTSGADKPRIMQAIDRLEAGGSTAGGAGITLAYNVARQNHLPNGNNRVILATDGDFNVGVSSDADMGRLIENEREYGTFLTVLGYGMGNYKDSKLETLADKGNGNYAYVDDIREARKVLVDEMGGTLFTVAKDVKLQVEFNPARVSAYRLIGYENRALRSEDFADDKKDAGEMGAGHSVTALYEIIPKGVPSDVTVRAGDTLRYQTTAGMSNNALSNELMTVKLRYKKPDGKASIMFSQTVLDRVVTPSSDFTFAAAVAALGMIMRDSEHKGSATIEDVIAMAQRSLGNDVTGYRAEFLGLARAYGSLLEAQAANIRRE